MLTASVQALLSDPFTWSQLGLMAMLLGPGGNPIFGPSGGVLVPSASVNPPADYTLTDTGNAVTNGQWLNDLIRGTNVSGQNGALAQLAFGDIVELPAGVTFKAPTGGYIFPALGAGTNTDADYITIRSASYASLPSAGTRVNPLVHAALMPKLTNTGSSPIFALTEAVSYSGGYGAHHWKLLGLEITNTGEDFCSAGISLSMESASSRAVALAPHHFRIERCFIHPKEVNVAGSLQMPASLTVSWRHAIQFTNKNCVVKDSYVVGAGPFEGHLYGTDLVIDASDNTKVSSASRGSFVSGDIGYQLVITAGTGFTRGRYEITAVSGGKAVLNAACGTVGSTGGTWGRGFVSSGAAFMMNAGQGSVTLQNNRLQSCYNAIFCGGSDNHATSYATIATSSIDLGALTGTVTFTGVTGTAPVVGDWISFQDSSTTSGGWSYWKMGKVTSITAGPTYNFDLKNGHPSYGNVWATAPYVGGSAKWAGDNIENVTVRSNHLLAWPEEIGTQDIYDTFDFYPKGICEIKDGSDMLWEGNLMESFMACPISCYPNNQDGRQPWVRTRNVTFQNNVLKGLSGLPWVTCNPGYAAASTEDYTCTDILIHNNLEISGLDVAAVLIYDAIGVTHGADGVTYTHNTCITERSIANQSTTRPTLNGVVRDNIFAHQGTYGFNADTGTPADKYSTWTITYNLIVNTNSLGNGGNQSFLSGTNNFTPTTLAGVGFENTAIDDYRLSAGSSYRTMSSTGGEPGVNFTELYAEFTPSDWPFSWTP